MISKTLKHRNSQKRISVLWLFQPWNKTAKAGNDRHDWMITQLTRRTLGIMYILKLSGM